MTRGGMALVCVVVVAGCSGGSDARSGLNPVAPSPATPAPSPSTIDVCGAIGTAPPTIRTIINGQSCSPGASSVVSLRIVEADGEMESLCSGIAIATDAVLTAAHCLPDGAQISVVAGSRTLAVTSTHPVASFSEEDEASLDIGVVRTAGPIGQPIMPILTSRDAVPGEEGVVAGYGLDNLGGDSALKAGTMARRARQRQLHHRQLQRDGQQHVQRRLGWSLASSARWPVGHRGRDVGWYGRRVVPERGHE